MIDNIIPTKKMVYVYREILYFLCRTNPKKYKSFLNDEYKYSRSFIISPIAHSNSSSFIL